jgi:hypothetical protein
VALRKPTENQVHPAGASMTAFEKLSEKIPSTADFIGQPDQLTRAVARAWKDAGKTLNGKPRHSDRFLAEQLKAQGAEVKSLTPKLVGKTRLRPEDASILLHYFLSQWPREGTTEDGDVTYVSLLRSDEIAQIADTVSAQIRELTLAPVPSVSSPVSGTPIYLPGEDIGELLPRYYEQCDALFTVGTERPLVTQHPRTELLGFRNLMNLFQDIDADGRKRPLIWVLDMGRQVFEESDVESRQRYLGVQALITRFKALRLFEDRHREERWAWLKARAFFIVLDTKFEHVPGSVRVARPNFLQHQVSFSAIAPIWAMNANFRALYGSNMERLDQRSFSVFFNADGWPNEQGDTVNRRYFGYAQFTPDPTKPDEKVGRGLELPSPGASYEVAYSTAYAAAVAHLRLEDKMTDLDIPGHQAQAQLHALSFRTMGLEEFMTL